MTLAGFQTHVVVITPSIIFHLFGDSISNASSERKASKNGKNPKQMILVIWLVIILSIDWMLGDSYSFATRLVILQEIIRSIKTPGKIKTVIGRIRTVESSPVKK